MSIRIVDGAGVERIIATDLTDGVHKPIHKAELRVAGSDVSDANPLPAKTVSVVADSTGTLFCPDALPQTLAYSGSNLSTVTVTDGVNTWVQTFTYAGSLVTHVTAWVKQ